VATLIIALSVLNGFEKTLTEKVIDFDAHIKITSFRTTLPDYESNLPRIHEYLKDFDPEITPFASNLAIISSKKRKEGINVIGIDKQSQKPGIIKNFESLEIESDQSNANNLIIGRKLAEKLFVSVGDDVTLFALNNDKIPSPVNLPNIDKFIISGIFESGMAEYDDLYAYSDLKTVQKLFGFGDNITGYNITLRDISKVDSLSRFLTKKLRYPHFARSIYQVHSNIFNWIELQKKPIPIALGLIIIVAVFNIIGTLLMVVLEKTSSIGVLKSLGAKNIQVTKIFLLQGTMIAIAGILIGNLLSIILMQIQLKFDIINLPSSVYFMSKVPIEMTPQIFLIVSVFTILLCLTASIIPSIIASRIRPVETLRFG
jgi:lipoprotein-releasing system permease protein